MAKWLCKTEPSECSIDDFTSEPGKAIVWEGVRNYQARNFMRQMALGDEVMIYHSSCALIGVAGIVKVVKTAYPDPSQFDKGSVYHDPKSPVDNPRWDAVDMVFVRKLPQLIPLDTIRNLSGLDELPLVRRGNRLSVMPVSEGEWQIILSAAS